MRRLLAALTCAGLFATHPTPAPAADSRLVVGTGLDYSSGGYGESVDTDIVYVPLTIKYELERWTARATLSYLSVTAPSDTLIVDGRPIAEGRSVSRTSASGPGDIVLSAGYAFYENAQDGVILDAIGKLKVPTADESKGLGTGRTDYALQVDGLKALRSWSLVGTVGYRWLGSPQGIELDDVWFGSVGVVKKLNPDWSGGLLHDYRQASTPTGASQSETTLYVSRRVDAQTRVQLYTIRGFSDGSPDWGVGSAISRRF